MNDIPSARDQGNQEDAQQIALVLVPGFSMVGFTATVEPLYTANRLVGRELFTVTLVTRSGPSAVSGSGFSIPVQANLEDTSNKKFDLVIVCAGFFERKAARSARLLDWLRRHARRGCVIGAISTGAEILANAGLLDGHKCTIHWENENSFMERHPSAILTGAIYEMSRNRITAAGGIAALDMMLCWISQTNDEYLVTAIAEQFVHTPSQFPGQMQRNAEIQLAKRRSPKLAKAIELMKQNVENPLTSNQVARQVGLSRRQLERLFSKHRHKTLHRYYLELRLNHARFLIFHSDLSLMQISIAAGFCSQSHFSRRYKDYFQSTPTHDRKTGVI